MMLRSIKVGCNTLNCWLKYILYHVVLFLIVHWSPFKEARFIGREGMIARSTWSTITINCVPCPPDTGQTGQTGQVRSGYLV